MTDAITVSSLSKNFRLYHERNQSLKATVTQGRRSRYEDFVAIRDVTFSIAKGSTFGIIGSNGSGKSTLLKCLAGILTPDSGTIEISGRVVALLELGAGFHPELSGRENIFLNGAILGMTRDEIKAKFEAIVAFSGLERFIDTPIKNYSSGMIVRLGFAIAVNVEPDILIIDEVLSVGDENFQNKCNEKIEEFRRSGRTIILVSHGLTTVTQLCDQVLWLEQGVLKQVGDAQEVVQNYLSSTSSQVSEHLALVEEIRSGTGEVRISNVSVSDGAANHSGVFSSGDPMQITFALKNFSHTGMTHARISIHDISNILIWQNETHKNEIFFDLQHNLERLITCRISELPLLQGIFQISIVVTNESGSVVFDEIENVARFNVLKNNLQDSGLLALESHWLIS